MCEPWPVTFTKPRSSKYSAVVLVPAGFVIEKIKIRCGDKKQHEFSADSWPGRTHCMDTGHPPRGQRRTTEKPGERPTSWPPTCGSSPQPRSLINEALIAPSCGP